MRADRPNFGPVSIARVTTHIRCSQFGARLRVGNRKAFVASIVQEIRMSARNGDRARFQKDRKRKMLRRQRIQELAKAAAGRKLVSQPERV